MIGTLRTTALAMTLAALALPCALEAQEPGMKASFSVDESLAKKGKGLWLSRSCNGCHTIGKGQLAGPDLAGALERRDLDWLKRWLTSTNEMLETDPVAQEMLKQYKNVRMPDMKLSESDADALLHFVAQEAQKRKAAK